MTSIPNNLTLIREDFRDPRSLSEIKSAMLAAPTPYVMVVGHKDIVDVSGILNLHIHYLQTHVATRREFRYSKPLMPFSPILLLQFNCHGIPILHKDMVPLFPDTSVEPWHRTMVRALLAGAAFGAVGGSHTIIEPWPRPELTGAYAHYRFSLDPEATMEAVPTVLVTEVNQQPFYRLRKPVSEAITAFCRNCSETFVASLAAPNVSVETLPVYDHARIRRAKTNYVAWFDGIAEAADDQILSQLQLGLEFPGVRFISPRLIPSFSIPTYHHPAFSTLRGISSGFNQAAWMTRTSELGSAAPSDGYTNNQAILREIS